MSDPPLRRDGPAWRPERPDVRARERRPQRQGRAVRWLAPGIGVKRWLSLFVLCTLVGAVGFLHFTWTGPWHFTATRWILWVNHLANPDRFPLHLAGLTLAGLSLLGALYSIAMLNRSLLRGTGSTPASAVDVIYEKRTLARGVKVVAVGGGTGLSNLLSGLKKQTGNITAVVTVADDGGSSGRLREALDMVAPGDLTDCYAALSDSPVLARLLLHRFERGEGIEGHTFGNLMLATLSEEQGGLETAMQDIHEVLRVQGAVFPATTHPPTLVAHLTDGRTVRGESQFVSQVGDARIERVSLDPPDLPALPQVLTAIAEAEVLVLGPGSLYTSIIPALLVPDIAHAVRNSAAPLIYVASIMTEPGETTGFTLQDHVSAIAQHLGRLPDCVLMNDMPVSAQVLRRYHDDGAELVNLRGADRDLRSRVLFAPLLQPETAWHNPDALANAIVELTSKQR
ncbi:uridine diphosphate-N-acetylglucosamine-binding protein YvcK [Deinococcus fonticola]|uniref:gluconeogenesis factor YvcK family protein n=1 Tax=Deinococcus fonticola TaxID=2528713 RepID=UPI0030B855CA